MICERMSGGQGGRAVHGVALEEREARGARGRHVLNRLDGSELMHGTDSGFHAWHQAHAQDAGGADFPAEGGVGTPGAKVHFSVMHVVHPREGDERDESERRAPEKSADAGVFELMHHADSMLDRDNAQLDEENKKFAESKPKGLYKRIESAKRKSEQYDREAVDHKVDSGFKSQEAAREDLRSDVETRRSDVAEALAHEFQAKIEQHKRELAAERMRAQEEKTQEHALHIRHEAAADKDQALRDARLAGRLDDKADESSIEARRVRQEEDQSELQLRQLNDEVKRAEDEAKRAREDAHRLRHEAAQDVRVAKASLSSASKLIAKAQKARREARTKQTELSEARLALKAAGKVETQLTVKAAAYTGKAKLDILQSKLLNQAASTHGGSAQEIRKNMEKKQESVERLREKEEHAQTKRHEAEVRRPHSAPPRSLFLAPPPPHSSSSTPLPPGGTTLRNGDLLTCLTRSSGVRARARPRCGCGGCRIDWIWRSGGQSAGSRVRAQQPTRLKTVTEKQRKSTRTVPALGARHRCQVPAWGGEEVERRSTMRTRSGGAKLTVGLGCRLECRFHLGCRFHLCPRTRLPRRGLISRGGLWRGLWKGVEEWWRRR